MRLDLQERTAIENSIKDIEGEVFLFGSRLDLNKKGGDIDLLIFSTKNPLNLSIEVSRNFFMSCEEKIDVVVMDPHNLSAEQKAFLNLIHMEKIK